MSKSLSARAILRRAAARVALSLSRRARDAVSRPTVTTEALEARQLLARVIGIDVSNHQGLIDWQSVATAGYEFAFAKATEGVGSTDARMAENFNGGTAAGLLMGAYHHAKPDASSGDAIAEANYFVQQAGSYLANGFLRPALDVSEGAGAGGLTKAQLSTWVNTFISTVENATGVEPIVYANNDYVTNYLDGSVAANHDLWIARWSSAFGDPLTTGSPPTGAWGGVGETWDFWQHTNSATVAGISGAVDRDVFNGDRSVLESFMIGGPPAFSLKLDFGPAGSSVPAGYLNVASDLFGAQSGQQMGWLQSGVTTYTRAGGSAPDNRYRTYAMPALNGVSRAFEVAVPNGIYSVRVVTGSPDQFPNAQKITVEGVTAVNASTSSTTPFITGTVTVNVTDGKLTLGSDYNGWANTRLAYVDISSAAVTGTGIQASFTFGEKARKAVPGYFNDFGQGFGLQRNGQTFGWLDVTTSLPASRVGSGAAHGGSSDPRRTQSLVTGGQKWEIALPNGTYWLKLVAGDGDAPVGATLGYDVEGVSFLRGSTIAEDGVLVGGTRWKTVEAQVTVADGRLTITRAAGMSYDALTYLEISDYFARGRAAVAAPTNVVATAAGDNVTDIRWTDASDNEDSFRVERATSANGPWTVLNADLTKNYSNVGFYVDNTGDYGATYIYRVTALKGSRQSTPTVSNAIVNPATNVHGRMPYNPARTRWTTDSAIQAEDYDVSGSGAAYSDESDGNAGGYYRSGNGDIGFNSTNGRYFVGWHRANEWHEYTLDVPTTGIYALQMSVASATLGGKFSLSVNGSEKTSGLRVPNTGSVADYQVITSSNFALSAGTKAVFRITATGNGQGGADVGDVDWIKIVPVVTYANGFRAYAMSPAQVFLDWSDAAVPSGNIESVTSSIYRRKLGESNWGSAIATLNDGVETYLDDGLSPGTTYEYWIRQYFQFASIITEYSNGSSIFTPPPVVQSIYAAATTPTPPLVVSVAASQGELWESAASSNQPGSSEITLTRMGETTQSLDVFVYLGGSASNGADYTALEMVTIPAGASSASFTLQVIDDQQPELTEYVVVKVGASNGYYADAAPATIAIHDDDLGEGETLDLPPMITWEAHVTASPPYVTSVGLSVSAEDESGPAGLIYSWQVTGRPEDAPVPDFDKNDANDAASVVATFFKAGHYTFAVTVTDAAGHQVLGGTVGVDVDQVLTSGTITPASVTLEADEDYTFDAIGYDQFGDDILSQLTWQWSLASGSAGSNSANVYHAPASSDPATATMLATRDGMTLQASIYISPAVVAPSGVTATAGGDGTSLLVAWTDEALNEDGYVITVSSLNGAIKKLIQVDADEVTATVSGLLEGTPYLVSVAAIADGVPSPSTAASDPVYTRLKKATDASAERVNSSVRVVWIDRSEREIQYRVVVKANEVFVDEDDLPVPIGRVLAETTVAKSTVNLGSPMSCDVSGLPADVDLLIEIIAVSSGDAEGGKPERSSIAAQATIGDGSNVVNPLTGIKGANTGFPFELSIGANRNSSVDITGVAIPEPSPTGEGEDDRRPNASRVEMFGLTPSFSATDIAVPMPGGELLMEVRRNQSIDVNNVQSDFAGGNWAAGEADALANFKWEAEGILGATWSSNLAIRAIQNVSTNPEPGEPAYKVTVVDEGGASMTYASNNRKDWHPYVKSSADNDAFKSRLFTLSSEGPTGGLLLQKAHGTQLYFESFQGNTIDRAPRGGAVETYYRLSRIVDRNKNVLKYAYGDIAHNTLPTVIYDPSLGNPADPTTSPRRIELEYGDAGGFNYEDNYYPIWRLLKARDPLQHETEYHYTGGLLSEVVKPAASNGARPTVKFTYQKSEWRHRVLKSDSLPGFVFTTPAYQLQQWTAPKTIEDANGNVTTFNYVEEEMPSSIRATTNIHTGKFIEIREDRPRISSIVTADGTATFETVNRGFPVENQVQKVTTRVRDVRGVWTYYTYDLSTAEANNDLGYGLYVSELVRRTDVPALSDAQDPKVKYTYGNKLLGNLMQVVDISGNVVKFNYDSGDSSDPYNNAFFDVGGTFYNRYAMFEKPASSVLDAGGSGHLNLTTQYRYELAFNKLIREVDRTGGIVQYTIDDRGNRIAMVEGAATSAVGVSAYVYDARGFMTRSTDPEGRVTDFKANQYGQTEYTIVKGFADEDLTPGNEFSFYGASGIDPDAKWLVTRSVSDVMGRLLESYDAAGNKTTYTYDDLSRQTSVTSPPVVDPANPLLPPVTSTAYTFYDANGNVSRTKDDNGNVTTTTYDEFNRPLVTRRRMNNPDADSSADIVTSVDYYPAGLLWHETDANGRTTDHEYDELQRRTKTTLPAVTPAGGSLTRYSTSFQYGPNSGSGAFTLGGFNPTRMINARGYATDTVYDRAYRSIQTVRRQDSGQGIASTAAPRAGEPTTQTQYDASGQPVKVTTLNETRTDESVNRSVFTYYDSRHRTLATVVDLDGDDGTGVPVGSILTSASQAWDAGDIITKSTYDRAGNVKTATNGRGYTTTTIYDGAGRAIEIRLPGVDVYDPVSNTTSANAVSVTKSTYGINGQPSITTDARGTRTQSTYDARGRVVMTVVDLDGDGVFETNGHDIVTKTGYDFGGRAVYSIDPRNNRTDTEYDRADRAYIVRAPAVADAENGNAMSRPTTVTEYDKKGNVLSVTDPRNIVTKTEYDELGRARFVIANYGASEYAADRLKTESRYDANGNVLGLILYNGSFGQQVTTYAFDAFDRRATETLPSVNGSTTVTTTHYNRAGEVIVVIDPKGQSVQTDYDRSGQVQEQRFYEWFPYGGGTSTGNGVGSGLRETRSSTYDKAGNLLTRTDLNGTSTYTYDALNRQKSEARVNAAGPDGLAGDAYTVQSWFDLNGNRTKVLYPTTGRALTSKYDRAGRMTELKDGSKITAFGYDLAGNRTQHVQANGQQTISVFDALNRVTSFATTAANATAVYSSTYGYDRASQRRTSTESIAGLGSRVLTWGYDGLYRLTGESWTGTEAQTRTYIYDPAGNRRSRTVTPVGGSESTTTSDFNALNQLVSSSGPDGSTSYSYDENGNRETKSIGGTQTEYFYDTLNRLTAVSVSGGVGGTDAEFSARYDARSRRISKTEDDEATRYRYDGGTNFQELDADDNVSLELIRAGGLGGGIGSVLYSDRRIEPATPGGTATKKMEFFAYNAVGSTVALTDAAGTSTQRTFYEAFGEKVIGDGDSKNNRLRNTKERDASIGLDNDGMRYYDPAVGSYIQRDPIGYGDGLNVYAHVTNNPINKVDPLGLSAFATILGTFLPESAMEGLGYSRTDGTTGVAPGMESAAIRYQGLGQMASGGVMMGVSAEVALSPSPEPASHLAGAAGVAKGAEIAAGGWDKLLNGSAATGVPTMAQAVAMSSQAVGIDPVTSGQMASGADNGGAAVPLVAGAVNLRTALMKNLGRSATAAEGNIANAPGVSPEANGPPKYASQVKVGEYLSAKAPRQVEPGTRVLEGQYIESSGNSPRVQPWKAHYDEWGRIVGRTDYNAGNKIADIPDTHYSTYEYPDGVYTPGVNHAPGEYIP